MDSKKTSSHELSPDELTLLAEMLLAEMLGDPPPFPEAEWEIRRPLFEKHLRQRLTERLADPTPASTPGVWRRQYESFLQGVNRQLTGIVAGLAAPTEAWIEAAPAEAKGADGGGHALALEEMSGDERFAAYVVETESGELSVSFDALEKALAGYVIRLEGGAARWQATFEPSGPAVACEILITAEERAELPRDAVLRVSLLGKSTLNGRSSGR